MDSRYIRQRQTSYVERSKITRAALRLQPTIKHVPERNTYLLDCIIFDRTLVKQSTSNTLTPKNKSQICLPSHYHWINSPSYVIDWWIGLAASANVTIPLSTTLWNATNSCSPQGSERFLAIFESMSCMCLLLYMLLKNWRKTNRGCLSISIYSY